MYVISITRCPKFFFLFSSCLVLPQVVAYKKSEHGNEGDTGVLTCKNPSFPAVTTWSWHKSGHGVSAVVCSFSPPAYPAAQFLCHRSCCKAQLSQEGGFLRWSVSTALRPLFFLLPPSSSSRTPLGDTSSSPVATRQSYASLNWILSRTQASIPATAPTPTAPGVPR